MRTSLSLLLTAAAFLPAQQPASLPAIPPVMNCAALRQLDFSAAAGVPVRITAAAEENAQPAAYCRVQGYISPAVEFEVRLPLKTWTQRYVQTGCGGLCGNLNIRLNKADGCVAAERGEFAMASTNMGHRGGDGVWAAEDPQLRVDFAYRGVHVTALAAKAIITRFYGQRPRYSYFAGCSDGGREALMEAQRFPEDFNGITAGAPAMNFITQNTFYHGWNARVNTSPDGRAVLTADKLPALHQAIVNACDELDGLKDGLISDPRACHADPDLARCPPNQDTVSCLTPAQVETARQIYQGAHDDKGRQLVISGPERGSELNWRGVFVPAAADQEIQSRRFAMDVIKNMAYWKLPPSDFSLNDFRFDQATFDAIKAMHPIFDSTDPDLTKFSSAGGRLILWHGWSDPHISPRNSIAYYTAMRTLMSEAKVKQFARLFLFPGGDHCNGGDGPFDTDLMTAIMNWVENNAAPEKLVASHSTGRIRPVFAYPMVARYTGSGSIDSEASFTAEQPRTALPEKFEWLGSGFFSAGYEQWCGFTGPSFSCGATRRPQ